MAEKDTVRLSLTQIVGGALAAIAAAVAASFLGVYGTIIGAAIMSVISTAGTVLYEQTVHRSKNKLNNRRPRGDGEASPSRLRGAWDRMRAQMRRPGWWKPVGLVSMAVFVVAIATVTIIETGTGKPLAATLTGGKSGGGTSIQNAVTGGGSATPDNPARPGGPRTGSGHDDGSTDGSVQPKPDSNPVPSTQQRQPAPGGQGDDAAPTTTRQPAQPSASQGNDTAKTPENAQPRQQQQQQDSPQR